MKNQTKTQTLPTTPRWILIYFAIANHLLWSTLAVSSRYLQVYASPQTFHGMTILAVTKASSFVLLFLYGRVATIISTDGSNDGDNNNNANRHSSSGTRNQSSQQKSIIFALLYGIASTCRACLNIASTKYTLSYNINTINSLTPLVVSVADALILKTRLPWYLWPSVLVSFLGCSLIALSQSPVFVNHNQTQQAAATTTHMYILSEQDAIGCALQFASVLFSCIARLLMKMTENILSRDEMVQVNNVFNTCIPVLYVFIVDPHAWSAFLHMRLTSFLALSTIAVLVYTIGSTTQMGLIRTMGVGVYSGYSGVRVLGSVLLSSLILKEPVQNWLEWLGLAVTTTTVTIYTILSSYPTEESKAPSHHHTISNETNIPPSTQDEEFNDTSISFTSRLSESELVNLLAPATLPSTKV